MNRGRVLRRFRALTTSNSMVLGSDGILALRVRLLSRKGLLMRGDMILPMQNPVRLCMVGNGMMRGQCPMALFISRYLDVNVNLAMQDTLFHVHQSARQSDVGIVQR